MFEIQKNADEWTKYWYKYRSIINVVKTILRTERRHVVIVAIVNLLPFDQKMSSRHAIYISKMMGNKGAICRPLLSRSELFISIVADQTDKQLLENAAGAAAEGYMSIWEISSRAITRQALHQALNRNVHNPML